MDQQVIQQTARKYKQALQKHLPIEKVIVFGSQITGKAHAWSDIDIAVVSPQLGKDTHQERLRLWSYSDKIDDRIEPHPFHPKDFQNKYSPLIAEIKKHGIVI